MVNRRARGYVAGGRGKACYNKRKAQHERSVWLPMTLTQILQEVLALPVAERKQVVIAILESLAPSPPRRVSLLEFEGVGKHLYDGEDAQEYITKLRREWDERP